MRSRLHRSQRISGWAAVLIGCLTVGQFAVFAATARADGALSITPSQGSVGTQIYVQPVVVDSIDSHVVCYVSWDKVVIAKFPCGVAADEYLGTYISATGEPGPHWISVTCRPTCNYSDTWQDSASFTVLSTVPSLLGLRYGSGVISQRLTDAALVLGGQSGATGDTASVISQKPAPGAIVQPGSAVYLVFGSPPLVTVPDLTNATPADAGTLLAGRKLKLGSVQGTGRVISQHPPAGSGVAPGSAVDIVLGLASRVVRQNPPPDSSAPSTTPVTIPSKGQAPPTVLVPDLRGLTSADAAQRLIGYRLVVGTRKGAGTVTEQDPAAGRRVRVGTAVNLFLSKPAVGLVLIPNLRGLDLGTARATAQAAGLRLDAGGATTGTVASQSLAAGSQVARGSVVTVTVAGPSIVAATADPKRTNWNPASWNIVALALIALAALLICSTGLLARTKRARRGSRARAKPRPPDGIEVSYRLAESRLRTTPTGSAPRRMRVDLHGPIAAIEIKEVPR